MIVVHMVADHAGNELSREELTVAANNEREFEAWLDDARAGFAVSGVDLPHKERYWARTAQVPQLTHYWWAASPFDQWT